MDELTRGNLFAKGTTFLASTGFSAFSSSQITTIQLANSNLIPVDSVQLSDLLLAKYVAKINGQSYLTRLAIQALLIHHIRKSDLQRLGLFPLPVSESAYHVLLQLEFITSSCNPTPIGFSAIHVDYFDYPKLKQSVCPPIDDPSTEEERYTEAGYLHPKSGMITVLGLFAIRQKAISLNWARDNGYFPCPFANASQVSDGRDVEENRQRIIDHLVSLNYLERTSLYISMAAYQAIEDRYFSIDNLRDLQLWPCRKPTLKLFIAAGYITLAGQLTTLGSNLLKAEYFPRQFLVDFGIQKSHTMSLLLHATVASAGSSNPYLSALTRGNPFDSLFKASSSVRSDLIGIEILDFISMSV